MLNLPNLSFMVRIGQVRAIQAMYESKEQRNPDYLASRILPISQRLGCFLRGRFFLKRMQKQPFYQYVLARTRYYDQVFSDAIMLHGVRYIVNIGCGGDTRAYRFLQLLSQYNVDVLECDQAQAIHVKRAVLQEQLGDNSHLTFQAIDLNNNEWPELSSWLEQRCNEKILIMLEGVSPYVNRCNFQVFLEFLFTRLKPGSRLAYDYKREGVVVEFGKSDRTLEPFRLRADADASSQFHQQIGFGQQTFELSEELTNRLAPASTKRCEPFAEDCLIQLLRV